MYTVPPHHLFNLKTDEFLSDIECALCDLPDFHMFKQSLKLLSSVDEKGTQRAFHTYMYVPYKDYIKTKNEIFFLTCNDGITNQSEFALIRILREKWLTLSTSDKEAIWEHLNVLVVLNERCNKKI